MDVTDWMRVSRQISLVLLFVLFVGIVVWSFWPGNKSRFEKAAQAILDDSDE
ncbi:MAG: cbb3-type cytochrome c oxidase subunit 3 [Magnetococcus sp. DMHC-8]